MQPAITKGTDAAMLHKSVAIGGPATITLLPVREFTVAIGTRSCGSTIAIVYDCRIGIAIRFVKVYANHIAMEIPACCMKGSEISNIPAGNLVNTIVFTSPIRLASFAPTQKDDAAPKLEAKKIKAKDWISI